MSVYGTLTHELTYMVYKLVVPLHDWYFTHVARRNFKKVMNLDNNEIKEKKNM